MGQKRDSHRITVESWRIDVTHTHPINDVEVSAGVTMACTDLTGLMRQP
jgi:hypothetical protein